VDVVVELPEIGKAVQYGRFNQGGEMSIFPENKSAGLPNTESNDYAAFKPVDEPLEGVNKKTTSSKIRFPKWVTNSELSEVDQLTLKDIYTAYENGNSKLALDIAHSADTFLREQIPELIWMRIGGKLIRWHRSAYELKLKNIVYPVWVEQNADSEIKAKLRELHDLYSDGQLVLAKRLIADFNPTITHLIPNTLLRQIQLGHSDIKKTDDSKIETPNYSDELSHLKKMHEENIGRKFTEKQFNEQVELALKKNKHFYENAIELQTNFLGFLMALDKATTKWEKG
jgi:hypothetical protein